MHATFVSFAPVLAAGGPASSALVDLLVVLACAAAVTLVLGRLRVSVVPGYLIAGVLVGPHAFGLVSGDDSVGMIADLALLFLMFQIGMHLDLPSLKGSTRPLLLVGVGTTLASTLIGWPIAMAFGLTPPSALAVAMALSLSSTAVVLKLLAQRRDLQSVYGRTCFGVLLVQDIVVLGFLAAIPMLARWGGVEAGAETGAGGGIAGVALRFGGVLIVLLIGRRLLPKLMNEAARTATPEVLLVLAAALALAAGMGSAAVGLSAEMGAFVAGLLLASTVVKHQLAGQLAPVRDLLMAVFFTAVGLNVDIMVAVQHWWVVLIAVMLMLTIKASVIGFGSWAVGVRGGSALAVGFTLAQAGEFSLIVLGSASAAGLLTADVESKVVSAVILGLIVTPALMGFGRRASGTWASGWDVSPWARRSALATGDTPTADDADERPSVLVVGYGPVGRAVAERVELRGGRVTILELNPKTVRRQRELGRSIVFGDASNPDVLEAAGVEHASAVIVTMPDETAMLNTTRTIRRLRPDVCVAVRTSVMSRAMMAIEAGATHVTVEEVATAEAMAAGVFKMVGLSEDEPADARATDSISVVAESASTDNASKPASGDRAAS
ncbi:MAG: cation:proton antiporter [Planctomycetota bacterium]